MANNGSTNKRGRPKLQGVVTKPKEELRAGAERAREVLAKKRELLNAIPVELQVRDVGHAKSKKVINYCVDQLSRGVSWAELRRKLGVGPAAVDRRWRVIREIVVEGLLPESEEAALIQQSSERQILLGKLEQIAEEIEARLETLKGSEHKNEHHFYKMKLDTIRMQLEENNKSFENYTEMRKLKAIDKKTQGTSIIIQNNYHINRPGDSPREVSETAKKVVNIQSTKAEVLNEPEDVNE